MVHHTIFQTNFNNEWNGATNKNTWNKNGNKNDDYVYHVFPRLDYDDGDWYDTKHWKDNTLKTKSYIRKAEQRKRITRQTGESFSASGPPSCRASRAGGCAG